jgi:ribose transport system ATP-binding protein
MKILNGDYSKDDGDIIVEGRVVDFRTPRDAQREGIRVIYQELNDAPDLSATENILLGQLPRSAGLLVDWKTARKRANDALEALSADFNANRRIRTLSVGQRQIVEIARALSASTAAKILVMDEPTAALTPREVDVLFDTIASLQRQGVGIIYISHRLDEVDRIAQRVMVLRDGKVAGVIRAAEISRREIVTMMVGHEVKEATRNSAPALPQNPPWIRVEHLSRLDAFYDVSFEIRPGEIVGMFGLLGAGQLDVARVLFGAERADDGVVVVGDQPLDIRSPREAKRIGLGLVTEDRKTEALIPQMSVADNMMLAHWPAVSTGGFVSRKRQFSRAREWIDRLGVRLKSGPRQPIATLSGGNQQKVILARWLETGVRVLLLNEPTRGVDVGARADIYALLAELRREGLAVLVASSDLEEILEVSDRVLVFAKGKLVQQFDRASADRVSLLAAAAG